MNKTVLIFSLVSLTAIALVVTLFFAFQPEMQTVDMELLNEPFDESLVEPESK